MYQNIKLFIFFLSIFTVFAEDKPCAPISYPHKSVVCVCNSSYCDTITRDCLDSGFAIAYVSSETGLRFQKAILPLESCGTDPPETATLVLNPTITYQTIEGFGGAVTDSAAINWKSLDDPQTRQYLIDSYCGSSGIGYSMIRVPMGASDYSTHGYTYDDTSFNDTKLTNFTLQPEDINYKIPMIKACMDASETPVKVLGSCWSPPKWMKTPPTYTGITSLLPEFYQTLVDYYVKFIDLYSKLGVPIWAVTTGNEPINGVLGFGNRNNLGWSVDGMCHWVRDFLSPTLRNCTNVKIFGVDDQRYTIATWITLVEYSCKGYVNSLDGVALHFYLDSTVPVSIIEETLKDYPELTLISSEASVDVYSSIPVDLGSWKRAEKYIVDIIEDLNNKFVSWIDWNMCLNMEGGPNWLSNFFDSPIIVNAEKGEFYKQPMFYAMGHFSKFIPRNSVRIDARLIAISPTDKPSILNVAFKTPQDTITTVLYNSENTMKAVTLRLGENQVNLCVEPKTLITVEMLNE